MAHGRVFARYARFALVALSGLLATAPGRPAAAQGPTAADEAKAAFLADFLGFVAWPEAAFDHEGAPIVVCVNAGDPLVYPLARIAHLRSVGSRRLEVRRRPRGTLPSGCHAAYLRATDAGELGRIIDYARTSGGLLTIGEIDGFASRGGVVELLVERDRIRFTINLTNAERAGLQISSKVLSLGRVVQHSSW
jgi:hypothetical protein